EALAREKFLRDQATREAWGREQGRAEGRAEVARNALGMGMSVDQICTLTGLSSSEVDRLTYEP
ncbi:MAG: hypothetical protein FWD11_05555, partial [Micrococcales bacterium]|nr:hypothetical protein [Micrococcales bacterium]